MHRKVLREISQDLELGMAEIVSGLFPAHLPQAAVFSTLLRVLLLGQ